MGSWSLGPNKANGLETTHTHTHTHTHAHAHARIYRVVHQGNETEEKIFETIQDLKEDLKRWNDGDKNREFVADS